MNIKKSHLAHIIKEVVKECIQERKDKWIQKAVDKSHKGYCTPMSKSTCTPHRKALAQRFKKGDLSEEQMRESGLTSENQTSPLQYIKQLCQAKHSSKVEQLHAALDHIEILVDKILSGNSSDGLEEASYKQVSPRQARVQKDDHARKVQTEPTMTEASYKVVSKNETDTSKEDKARRIQREPKVTENHKVQHRSYTTVNDVPQDPKNVRDPEVPMT